MSTYQNSGSQEVPNIPTGIEKKQIRKGVAQYETKINSGKNRASLAHTMHQEKPLSAALQGMNNEIENRPPEVILSRVSDVLTQERLKGLEIDDVDLWTTGGSAIVNTNKGLREYKGDNEIKRMTEINLLINTTADWDPESTSKEQSLLGMENKKLVLNRNLLEEALGYVSAEKRHTDPKRTEFFESYKGVLLDLIEAAQSPRDEYLYTQNHGSVAAEQLIQKHCLDAGNAKDAWKSIGVALMGILFAVNIFSDIKQEKFRVFTFVTLAGLAGLVGGSYKTDIFGPDTGFTHFCSTSLSRKHAETIFSLKPMQINAMLKYFKGQAGQKIEKDSIEELSNPTKSNGSADPGKAIPEDIAKIFVGLSGAQAHTNLNNLIKMKNGKNREVALSYIDATYKDGGQTRAEMNTLFENKKTQ